MKQIGLIIASVLAFALGYLFIDQFFTKPEEEMLVQIERYRATLTGEYTCLQYKDAPAEHNGDCALAIHTDNGDFYGVDFSLMSQTPPQLSYGARFTASGVVTPIEMLSTDKWQEYNVKGIFSITDTVIVATSTTSS